MAKINIPGFDEDIDFERDDASVRIKIYTETSKFNKIVTIISGVGKKNLDEVAKFLKKKLACGGTIREDGSIVLQGDHKRRVPDILKEFGYKQEQFELL
ncbi:MAG: stress response translation initiation inhibitor YciH [Candidatus Micrarchaeota archaeon]|nr:stress response translation initiation inhibitor YciH [Candidatus Micrarchaeota archaeon]